eukprot:scaffold13094_cov70-Phaeocystis_antarctica.AAC.5
MAAAPGDKPGPRAGPIATRRCGSPCRTRRCGNPCRRPPTATSQKAARPTRHGSRAPACRCGVGGPPPRLSSARQYPSRACSLAAQRRRR